MGSIMSVVYANLTLGYLEHLAYEKARTEHGEEYSNYLKEFWKRFLDDCFLLWCNKLGNVESISRLFNSMHNVLQFTREESKIQLPFLDTMVIIKDGCVITDIYSKPTDTHQYLPFNSNHPHHTKIAVPYNLARRIKLIVTEPDTQKRRFEELKHDLLLKKIPHWYY